MNRLKGLGKIAKKWIIQGFFSYWKRLFCIFAIPIMIFSVFLSVYLDAKRDMDEINYTTREFLTVCYKFNEVFNGINKNYINIIQQNELESYVINACTDDADLSWQITNALRNVFKNTISSSTYLEEIHFYSFDNNYVVSTANGNMIDKFYNRGFYDKYLETGRETNITLESEGASPEHINMCYGYYQGTNLKGLLVFSVSVFKLKDELLLNVSNDGRRMILTDSDNFRYASDDLFSSVDNLKQFTKDFDLSDTGNIRLNKYNGNYVLRLKSPVSDMEMLYVRKSDATMGKSYVWLSLWLIILVNAIVVIASLILARQLRRQLISIVSEFMEQFSPGETSGIDQLSMSIFDNLKSDEKPEIAFPKQMLNLRKTQFYALQMQLSPHFLYNTLNSVNLMAMRLTKSDNTISRLVVLLSELLYDVLDTKRYLVPLRKEIEYSKKFLEIENIKRKNLVEITWDTDEELQEYGVIKFILQPILENIFRHAFRAGQEDNKVKIEAKNIGESIIIRVTDNGRGMDEARLNEIRAALDGAMFKDKHIGLANVHKRIQLLYGSGYGLTIQSKENSGTVVEFNLPKINLLKGIENDGN